MPFENQKQIKPCVCQLPWILVGFELLAIWKSSNGMVYLLYALNFYDSSLFDLSAEQSMMLDKLR